MKAITLAIQVLAAALFSCCSNGPETSQQKAINVDTISVDTTNTNVATTDTLGAADLEIMDDEGELMPADFDVTYEGMLNNKIRVRLNIFQLSGFQKARLVYLNVKKVVNMDVLLVADEKIELTELIEGRVTGIWKVIKSGDDLLTGSWYSPDGDKQLSVYLKKTEGSFDDVIDGSQTGFYKYTELNDDEETNKEYPFSYEAKLNVKTMAGNDVYFDLQLSALTPMMHAGYLYGTASRSGDSYVFENGDGCKITMVFSNNTVTLDQEETDASCGFGANVSVYGTLIKQ